MGDEKIIESSSEKECSKYKDVVEENVIPIDVQHLSLAITPSSVPTIK